ncbi:MAG TPA: hypothetical protein VHG51_13065 [Longimicrobiaceae bacterium]|nr:hypothetical protein [Longimicrobiaceae bacterium]
MSGELWAATSYFNPCGYRSRRENYRVFRERLGVPLVTAELSFDGKFELGEDEADVVVRVNGGSILWQKERLLNLAVAALPPRVEHVAMLDCDIVFDGPSWAERTHRLLRDHPLVQPFTKVYRIPPELCPPSALEWTRYVRTGFAAAQEVRLHGRIRGALGGAWAARRSLLQRHGLYDACILGGGDDALTRAAFGDLQSTAENLYMNPAQQRHYRAWAEPFFAEVRGRVGFAKARIGLLWHGEYARRRYRDRHREMQRFGFDPGADIVHAESGAWRWSGDKPAMHEYVARYFLDRREDTRDAADRLPRGGAASPA